MADRALESALRRLDQDPEDRASLREARTLARRLRPDDCALRARLIAVGLRQAPLDCVVGELGAEDCGALSRAALAPDGRALMSFDLAWKEDHDGEQRMASSVRLWRRDGAAIGGHEGMMRSILERPSWAFSGDGRLALIGLRGGVGGGLALCDLKTGSARIFPRDQPETLAVARRPDGAALTALADASLEVFLVGASGEAQRKLRVPGRFAALAFDAAGERLAALRPGGMLDVFVLDHGPEPVVSVSFGEADSLSWLAGDALIGFHPDGLTVYVPTRGILAPLARSERPLAAFASEASGRCLVTVDGAGGLVLWDGTSGALLERVAGRFSLVQDLAIDEEAGRLIAVFKDRSLKVWPW